MSSTVGIVVGILLLSAAIALGWRLLSRRRLLPCPSSLAWILENPLMEGVAGSVAMLQRAGVEPGMKVLDAGCGPGRLTIPLARKVGKTGSVLALDAQASMLTKLKAKLEAQGLHNVRMMHAALGTGALGPERFDRAFLVTVLGEIPDQAGALGEIYEHLCPGGILTVCEVLPDPHYQRQAVVRRLAERAGFTVEIAYQNYRSYTMNLKRPAPPGETVSR